MTGALPVLVMGFVVLLFNSGARFSMGLMLHPMVTDLGWSRTTLSAVVTVFMVVAASALPFTGRLIDRIGARCVLLFGVIVSGVAVASMSFVTTPWQAFLCYGLLFALGSAATSITPIGVILSNWYPKRIGMANSIAISGMGVGQLLIISVLSAQLATLGWRGAFLWLGVATVALVLPLVWFAGREGAPSQPANGTAPRPSAKGDTTLRQALRRKPVWLLLVIYAICGFQDFLIATHMVALAVDEQVSQGVAGNMLALMGLAGLVGVLLTGWVNDRTGPWWPTGLCFIIRTVIFAAMIISREPIVIVTVGLIYGFTFWITAPLTVVFTRHYCGLALLGTISGLVTMIHHAAGGLGAVYAARVFDTSGSYQPAIWTMMLLSLAGMLLTAFLARHK